MPKSSTQPRVSLLGLQKFDVRPAHLSHNTVKNIINMRSLFILLPFAGVSLAQNASYYATSYLNATTTEASGSTVANADAFATTLAVNVDGMCHLSHVPFPFLRHLWKCLLRGCSR